ncbi:MAG TPA: DUF3489 domain-containing protein [Bryobacteraceae bacterium]|nr:DUF3489 domain-containing protein [Bryobacteraceae bacterium]
MTTFTIDSENSITAFASAEEAAAATTTPFDSFASQKELAELLVGWPAERLVALWNSLPGVEPVERFKTPKAAASRIWDRIQGLGEAAKPEEKPAKSKATKKAKGGAQAAKGAPAKGKASKKATPAKSAPKAKKAAKAKDSAGPREGSKTAQVVAMLQRKNGATLAEIMKTMGWLRHTVRGFVAGSLKKAGYKVESFKPEGGERTYRINS